MTKGVALRGSILGVNLTFSLEQYTVHSFAQLSDLLRVSPVNFFLHCGLVADPSSVRFLLLFYFELMCAILAAF